jgi:hypothetical protein
MREYRARKRAAHERYDEAKPLIGALKSRITELEEEVRHLKEELAKRPDFVRDLQKAYADEQRRFNSRPFTPVPKRVK